jgi:hypothetical protein
MIDTKNTYKQTPETTRVRNKDQSEILGHKNALRTKRSPAEPLNRRQMQSASPEYAGHFLSNSNGFHRTSSLRQQSFKMGRAPAGPPKDKA